MRWIIVCSMESWSRMYLTMNILCFFLLQGRFPLQRVGLRNPRKRKTQRETNWLLSTSMLSQDLQERPCSQSIPVAANIPLNPTSPILLAPLIPCHRLQHWHQMTLPGFPIILPSLSKQQITPSQTTQIGPPVQHTPNQNSPSHLVPGPSKWNAKKMQKTLNSTQLPPSRLTTPSPSTLPPSPLLLNPTISTNLSPLLLSLAILIRIPPLHINLHSPASAKQNS